MKLCAGLIRVSLALASVGGCGDSSQTTATGGANQGGSPNGGASQGGNGPGTGATNSGGGGASPSTGGSGGSGGSPASFNGFPPEWPSGEACGAEDPIFVWQLTPDTYILRQSLCTSFEGPFLYLLFGEDKVLLEDTGDGGIPVREVVQSVIDDWLVANNKASIELVVMHSHSHGDHVSGDGQFVGQPGVTLVGTGLNEVTSFFGIDNWATEIVPFELGGRTLSLIPIPGHQSAHVAIYDPKYELLLTGDTLYPGRLYIQNFGDYVTSVERLVDFANSNPVAWVLGTHIEMTQTPGVDFDFGADVHANERPLQLTLDHLLELEAAVTAMGNTPNYEVHDDFIIYPL